MKTFGTFLLLILLAPTAWAAPKIKQVDVAAERLAVSSTSETTIGSQWMATTPNKMQCSFEVTDVIANVAILQATSCPDLSKLKVGQKLEKSLFTKTSKTQRSQTSASAAAKRWMQKLKGFSVFAAYSLADEAKYSVSGIDATAEANKAFGLGAEYHYSLIKYTDGLPIDIVPGLAYQFKRTVDKVKASNGNQFVYNGSKPDFSLVLPFINAQYNLTQSVGAFLGVNYSLPYENNFQGTKLKSKLGYQLGATASVMENISVDALYRWVNLGSSDIGEVSLDGFSLRGRYVF